MDTAVVGGGAITSTEKPGAVENQHLSMDTRIARPLTIDQLNKNGQITSTTADFTGTKTRHRRRPQKTIAMQTSLARSTPRSRTATRQHRRRHHNTPHRNSKTPSTQKMRSSQKQKPARNQKSPTSSRNPPRQLLSPRNVDRHLASTALCDRNHISKQQLLILCGTGMNSSTLSISS